MRLVASQNRLHMELPKGNCRKDIGRRTMARNDSGHVEWLGNRPDSGSYYGALCGAARVSTRAHALRREKGSVLFPDDFECCCSGMFVSVAGEETRVVRPPRSSAGYEREHCEKQEIGLAKLRPS